MGSYREHRFIRPDFSPLPPVNGESRAKDSINCLPDLIRYNASENADQTFCIQGEAAAENSRRISFQELDRAVSACSFWVESQLAPSVKAQGEPSQRPIALYLESDVGLFIHIAAMLASSVPVVLLSARLSDMAVKHLLKETGATTLLVSSRTRRNLTPQTAALVKMVDAQPYHSFLEANLQIKRSQPITNENNRSVLILHSSGTTGLPKPIRLAHRYLLGYAACHNFGDDEEANWRNLSTLPLYHGFGLLAPCLSLSVGMTCCFPPSNTIPAAESTLRLLNQFQAQSLMTVPSILEDIVSLDSEQLKLAMRSLVGLRFVAVGGGPIKQQVGEVLASNDVKLLNHYGATEIGAIAAIFSPGEDYDWRYLRLRKDLGLQLRHLDGDGAEGLHKLVGFPCGWGEPFEIQDELELRPHSKHREVRILRRRDDLIVLKTGEKVAPGLLEESLSKDSAIRTAVCIGNGFFELVLLVERSRSADMDDDAFVDHVWNLVEKINPLLDQHARISSRAAIISKPSSKEIRRSDKGSVMRKEVQEDFKFEIQQAYEALESSATPFTLHSHNLESQLIDLVKSLMESSSRPPQALSPTDDLFEMGLDSLGTVRLARAINSALRSASPGTPPTIKPDFIYRNPTFTLLADALRPLLTGGSSPSIEAPTRDAQMRSMLSSFLTPSSPTTFKGATVLITGSTGTLGVHVLHHLALDPQIAHIICLNRPGYANGTRLAPRDRQAAANKGAGLSFPPHLWSKIEFLEANMQAADLGVGKESFAKLVRSVTHIVHLAWPMDFKRSLASFAPHVSGTSALADLAIAAHEASGGTVRPRLLFASSIAVLARYEANEGLVPETAVEDPLATAPMGYAEAKWVCEQMLWRKGREHSDKFDAMIVRIGQLSGGEEAGVWKVEEHFPTLVRLSQKVGALPALQGSYSWLPANRAGKVVVELLFQQDPVASAFFHVENPIRQPNRDLTMILGHELGLNGPLLPFEVWLAKVRKTGDAKELLEFFENDFEKLSGGTISLDTKAARLASSTLQSTSGVKKELVVKYVEAWKAADFLAGSKMITT